MRILIVTDAWHPQVNGVVMTLERLAQSLKHRGVETVFLTPQDFRTVALPGYAEIRLALATQAQVARRIDAAQAERIHIATEGPLGFLARRICLARGLPFTTSYHTRFPEFLRARLPIPQAWTYRWLRRFHNAGAAMMVATPSLGEELAQRGFTNIRLWSRGVDMDRFHPGRRIDLGFEGPVFLYVGRVAVEKNLPAFLDLDLPGTKVVVGDGPAMPELQAHYPDAVFMGLKRGDDLAAIYASADVFVFPSRTDTFGNVIIEALASGTPVAAYPVTGPLDILAEGGGVLDADLGAAAVAALAVPREAARKRAAAFDWNECAAQFLTHITTSPENGPRRSAA